MHKEVLEGAEAVCTFPWGKEVKNWLRVHVLSFGGLNWHMRIN